MFSHLVLFEIKPKFVKIYLKDCGMWAKAASKAAGFAGYKTLRRINAANQYASVYSWRLKRQHFKFMNEHHDNLVRRSYAAVKVLGYFNFDTAQELKPKAGKRPKKG